MFVGQAPYFRTVSEKSIFICLLKAVIQFAMYYIQEVKRESSIKIDSKKSFLMSYRKIDERVLFSNQQPNQGDKDGVGKERCENKQVALTVGVWTYASLHIWIPSVNIMKIYAHT